MIFLIVLALIVCIIALIMTISSLRTRDGNYSMNTSLKNLSVIYLIILPVGAIIIVAVLILFK